MGGSAICADPLLFVHSRTNEGPEQSREAKPICFSKASLAHFGANAFLEHWLLRVL